LATQTLVVFAIRARRIPFYRSHPSLPLTLAALGVVAIGAVLPATPLAQTLGFQPLPTGYFLALAGMVVGHLTLIEAGKRLFYSIAPVQPAALIAGVATAAARQPIQRTDRALRDGACPTPGHAVARAHGAIAQCSPPAAGMVTRWLWCHGTTLRQRRWAPGG
jgi:Mg2+-importing ATPase